MKNFLYLLIIFTLSSCEYYSNMVEVPVKDINGKRFATYSNGWVKEVWVKDSLVYVDSYCCGGNLTDDFIVIKGELIDKTFSSCPNCDTTYYHTFSDSKYYFIIKNFNYDLERATFLVSKENVYSHSTNKRILKTKRVWQEYKGYFAQ